MALVLYNTLTKRKEPLEPLHKDKIGIYVCGVTVYDQSHLGHAKSAINFDVIVRWLRHRGYDVKHVTNFTDVDDKIIARANEIGIDPLKLSQRMIDEYFGDMDALRIRRASVYPKASDTMEDIIRMVQGLIDKGYAYESNGSVYFSVRKAKEYGKLSRQNLDQMQAGARIEPGEDKQNPMDFALWKAAKPGEIAWDSPWGKGRPGWHIECSAMCLKHIGKTVDIHGGGTELIFPHHENEILQSEAYNDAPFVRYWMHNGLLTIDQEKMSKSLKNFFLIKDILGKHTPGTVRFYLLNAQYSQPLDYNEKSLEEAGKALERLQNTYSSMKAVLTTSKGTDDASELCEKAAKDFEAKMDDDFSTREAIAVMYDLSREANKLLSDGKLSQKGAQNVIDVFDKFNSIFDVLVETQRTGEDLSGKLVDLLLEMREEARERKDFAQADTIRKRLAELGIEIQDTQDGAVWKRK
ncbi:MAG: cysteine--tRNA ligase [Euryarchaeota archaeon RBG_13_57_23]|nr:MAG: cysteine--tRNA ligase [Euryarchaeota archaeon RBG_13_57_23]